MVEKKTYLYRGVSAELYEETNGKLIPKSTEAFSLAVKWGEFKWDSGATWDSSSANAVLKHQYNQQGFPTSGISTTPHFARACFYATNNGKYKSGYIYKIDRELLVANGVIEFVVEQFVTMPSVPEDNEVILVAKDFGALPDAIIADIIVTETQDDVEEK